LRPASLKHLHICTHVHVYLSKLGLVAKKHGNRNIKVRSHSSGMSQRPHLGLRILASLDTYRSSAARTKMDTCSPPSDPADDQSLPGRPTRPFTLVLISHSHAPPLLPEPHLRFDLRKTSNPPKHIRDAFDGRSKRLREHMMASDEFCALLDTAQARIEEQMSSFAEKDRGGAGKHISMPLACLRWI
jgi:hypothetical protein